ncbi:MAG TPA: formylglycine-generating enzyme family protein, partial [Aggregatilineales bacterium]|nr:formylglycine-generating enzyme family protein [Aggregatilineales bacterium]
KYPVTQANFIRLNGKRSTGNNFIGDNLPVETINWYESQDFCALRGGRLPTEAEWEYATRGPDGLIYSWGNEWDETQLVWNREESLGTVEVGSIEMGASWIGAYDLIGNVWEWTSTIYSDVYPYPYISNDGRNLLARTTDKRVLRGGAWSSITLMGFRATYRTASRPHSRYYSLSFRCVMDE